jgi:anion-transporting  ArsA/GET3 family ATPase
VVDPVALKGTDPRSRRVAKVTILLGKGGTGRTTVSRAIALNRAERSPTALLHAHPSTQVPDERVRNLRVRVLDPRELLDDRVQGMFPLGPLTRAVTSHPAYDSFLEIAAGILEAAMLDHVFDAAENGAKSIVLDGPATGHGLHLLEAPRKLEQVTTGRVAKRLREIDEALRDPERTEIVLVALPEELPTMETVDLAQDLGESGFEVSGLVVNRMPPPVPGETGKPPEQPGSVDADDRGRGSTPTVGSVSPGEALALLSAQREEADQWLARLEETGLAVTVVPFLPGCEDLAEEVAPFVEGFA